MIATRACSRRSKQLTSSRRLEPRRPGACCPTGERKASQLHDSAPSITPSALRLPGVAPCRACCHLCAAGCAQRRHLVQRARAAVGAPAREFSVVPPLLRCLREGPRRPSDRERAALAQVSDVKLALQQWVLAELSVHCAAVETLSATAALLGAVDPNAAMLGWVCWSRPLFFCTRLVSLCPVHLCAACGPRCTAQRRTLPTSTPPLGRQASRPLASRARGSTRSLAAAWCPRTLMFMLDQRRLRRLRGRGLLRCD